jgi:cytoskeletal protein CcmA (bactofilin family)
VFEKIISKTPETPQAPRPAAPTRTSQTPAAAPARAPQQAAAPVSPTGGQRNILSNDVHIKGSVRFTDDLLVDGRIEGEISSDGALTVAENAHLKAEVSTKSIVIYGKVHGNVTCTERVEIKGSAEMVGDVKAGTISIEPGAIFVGKSEVGNPSSAPKKSAPIPQTADKKNNNPQPNRAQDNKAQDNKAQDNKAQDNKTQDNKTQDKPS